METTIVKIEGNKIQAVVDNDVKEYDLESWVKPDFVKLGAAEITIKDGKVSFVAMKDAKDSTGKGDAKSDKVVNIKGKDFVTYAGLLDQAHKKGLQNIEILESWVSEDMTRAWCKVRARFIQEKKEMYFDGFGSSTPENTGDMTAKHPVEMCHTRAKGRALRDFLNIGTAMLEELKQEK